MKEELIRKTEISKVLKSGRELTLARLGRVDVFLPRLPVHHDTRPVMSRHGNVDIVDILRPALHQPALVERARVARKRARHFDLAVYDLERDRVRVGLDGLRSVGDDGRREGPEGEDVVEGLVEFVNQDDAVGLRKLEPVRPARQENAPSAPRRSADDFWQSGTHHLSNPFGGLRLYLRLYSRTASTSVLLCLASLASHSLVALLIKSWIGCRIARTLAWSESRRASGLESALAWRAAGSTYKCPEGWMV